MLTIYEKQQIDITKTVEWLL